MARRDLRNRKSGGRADRCRGVATGSGSARRRFARRVTTRRLGSASPGARMTVWNFKRTPGRKCRTCGGNMRAGRVCAQCATRRTKICRLCKRRKEVAEFARHPMTRDGRANECKDCKRTYDNARYDRSRPADRPRRKVKPICGRPGCGKRCKNSWSTFCSHPCAKETQSKQFPTEARDSTLPVCVNHPGTLLSFGSHPLTGMSMEYCPKCGWRQLQRRLSA